MKKIQYLFLDIFQKLFKTSCLPYIGTTDDGEGDEVLDKAEEVFVVLEHVKVESDSKKVKVDVMGGEGRHRGEALEQLEAIRNNVLWVNEGGLAHVLENVCNSFSSCTVRY